MVGVVPGEDRSHPAHPPIVPLGRGLRGQRRGRQVKTAPEARSPASWPGLGPLSVLSTQGPRAQLQGLAGVSLMSQFSWGQGGWVGSAGAAGPAGSWPSPAEPGNGPPAGGWRATGRALSGASWEADPLGLALSWPETPQASTKQAEQDKSCSVVGFCHHICVLGAKDHQTLAIRTGPAPRRERRGGQGGSSGA